MENGCVCKMKYIMKAVSIVVGYIVCQRISDENSIPLEIASAAFTLINTDFKVARKLLVKRKI
ncbi:hypothetical protein D3C75_1108570 [compost metagenome]